MDKTDTSAISAEAKPAITRRVEPAASHPTSLAERIASMPSRDRLDAVSSRLQGLLMRAFRLPGGKRAKDFLNGTWLGHPLHPALTDIPIGAWTTAAVLDVATLTGRRNYDAAASAALAFGAAGAVGAALSGVADWSDTGGAQRRVGLAHAAGNTVALALMIASLWARHRQMRGARALSLAGLGVAATAAHLGGDLVFRFGTQVNRTAWHHGARDFAAVMPDAELASDRPTRVEVAGAPIMLARHQGNVYALDDVCSHAGCSLSQGRVTAGTIACPCHGSTYRLRDGAVIHGPSTFAQPAYDVRIDEGLIHVRSRPR